MYKRNAHVQKKIKLKLVLILQCTDHIYDMSLYILTDVVICCMDTYSEGNVIAY